MRILGLYRAASVMHEMMVEADSRAGNVIRPDTMRIWCDTVARPVRYPPEYKCRPDSTCEWLADVRKCTVRASRSCDSY